VGRKRDFAWLEERRLYCSGKCEGSSAELGFALALLLGDHSCKYEIIATGALGGLADHVKVEAVAKLPEKLQLVMQEYRQGLFGDKPILVFTPFNFINRVGELENVVDLVQVAELRAIGIQIVPIESLIAAVNFLLPPVDDPYLGLRTFQSEDAHLFFGRQQQTLELMGCLKQSIEDSQYCRWLQLEGGSGVGKSSLVNAGLLPLIREGELKAQPGLSQWQILDYRMPGEKPLSKLASLLVGLMPEHTALDGVLKCLQQLEQDDRYFSLLLKNLSSNKTGYVLFIDQFEELFVFSDKSERRYFDTQLDYALRDKDCPLFLITTVRIDFLDQFEQLPRLSEIYNSHCQRYLLKSVSQQDLRDIIERPARLAGLDVSEVTEVILNDAQQETGALPLVENALHFLYQQRLGIHLSGKSYTSAGGLIGMLANQADDLLNTLSSKDRLSALELLLAMTRINPEGQHTRRRISQSEAQNLAGDGDKQRGQRIIDYLSGGKLGADGPFVVNPNRLRLITSFKENHSNSLFYDLIHETLIRARGDDKTGQLMPYWPTLFNYIQQNRNRGFYRQRLEEQAHHWQTSSGLKRWWRLAGLNDLRDYRRINPLPNSVEGRYIRSSRITCLLNSVVMAMLLVVLGESYYWTWQNELPISYMLMQQRFRLIDAGFSSVPLPVMVEIPAGQFRMGEIDPAFIELVREEENDSHFGIPATRAVISEPFAMGAYETSFREYDYYVWHSHQQGNLKIKFPTTGTGGRDQQPVVNVSWIEATEYAKWLSDITGQNFRLPTEAEWEYAARGGTNTVYWWGDEIGQNNANCSSCGNSWDGDGAQPIDSYRPNQFGLYNMLGNVTEWTCSIWERRFKGNQEICADSKSPHSARTFRGGTWYDADKWLRSSARDWGDLVNRNVGVGFRVARFDDNR
ncbi:MAG: SUMF1/EgtB/PvdO family nonheme iron enzyme, partial [Methylomonas sp.]